jgi:hypothetical protein
MLNLEKFVHRIEAYFSAKIPKHREEYHVWITCAKHNVTLFFSGPHRAIAMLTTY